MMAFSKILQILIVVPVQSRFHIQIAAVGLVSVFWGDLCRNFAVLLLDVRQFAGISHLDLFESPHIVHL